MKEIFAPGTVESHSPLPVRIGIIGCGVIARLHAKSIRACPHAVLQAVADVREDAARQMAVEFGVARAYGDPRALLADDQVDAVVLAFMARGRVTSAVEALRAGKHVLVEKPVAMNAAEVRTMIAARGDRVAGCCSSRYRCTETARRATNFLAEGKLGALRHLRCLVHSPPGPRPLKPPPAWRLSKTLNGGGILVNWGCYDLDFLLGVANWGRVPCRVLGATFDISPQYASWLPPSSDAETHVVALVRFTDGVILSMERSEYYPGMAMATWEIVGEQGTLSLKMHADKGPMLVLYQEAPKGGLVETVLWEGPDTEDIHGELMRDFVTAIRARRPALTTLEQALVVQQITDAVYASAAQGAIVELNP